MSSFDDMCVFVGTIGEGLWRSYDRGDSWARTRVGESLENDIRAIAVNPVDSQTIFAGTNEGCFRSDDGGDNWKRLGLDSAMNDMVIWSILILPERANIVFAGTSPADVFRSFDGGNTWEQLDVGMAQECPGIVYNRVTTLQTDPALKDTIWAGVEIDGAWCSRDLGASWVRYADGLSSLDVHGLSLVPQYGRESNLVVTTNNDVNTSKDSGKSWTAQHVGNRFLWPYCRGLKQQPGNPNRLFLGNGNGPPGSQGAVWCSNDEGDNWEEMILPEKANSTIWDYAFHPADPELVYAYSVSGQVFRSVDGGQRWEKIGREFGEIRSLAWVPKS